MPYTIELNSPSPEFNLLGTDDKYYKLSEFKEKYLVIFFTCNHCPYVIGSDENTREIADKYKEKDVKFIAINSNSPNTYPEDSFENMVIRMEKYKFPWVYLYDASQQVALSYGALKTPHFFLFNSGRKLVYCGRAIDNPKHPEKSTCFDLDNALKELTSGKKITTPLTNPIGCNIKWDGKDAKWMPPEACDLVI